MRRLLDHFRREKWRAVASGIVLAAVTTAGYLVAVQQQYEAVEDAQNQLLKRMDVFLEKKKLAVKLEGYQRQRDEVRNITGPLIAMVGTDSSRVYSDLMKSAAMNDVRIQHLQVREGTAWTDLYAAEMPARLKVLGRYHNLARFLQDVAQLPQYVVVSAMRLDPDKHSRLVALEADMHVVRYLSEAEVEARKPKKRARK